MMKLKKNIMILIKSFSVNIKKYKISKTLKISKMLFKVCFVLRRRNEKEVKEREEKKRK